MGPGPTKDPSLAYVLGRGQNLAKLPSPLPGFPHGTSPWLCEAQCTGYSGLRASLPGERGGREGDEGHMLTPLFLQVHLQTHPPPTHLRSPGRSRKPPCHPPGGPRDGVDSAACLGWGICVLGLGLHLLGGVLLGRGSGSLGPQTLPTLSLVLMGTRQWGRVSMPGLR